MFRCCLVICLMIGSLSLEGMVYKGKRKFDAIENRTEETTAEESAQESKKRRLDIVVPQGEAERRQKLFEAVIEQDLDMVKALIETKMDLNDRYEPSDTPLFLAINGNDIEIAKALIKAGADVNMAVEGNITPLAMAVTQGQIELVELLLNKGAVVNVQDQAGMTPLMRAAKARNVTMVKLLLRAGADPALKNNKELLAQDLPARPEKNKVLGEDEVVLAEEVRKTIEFWYIEGPVLLFEAVQQVDAKKVHKLLNLGVDVNQFFYEIDEDGPTPLMAVVSASDKTTERRDIVCMLLAFGADVNAKNRYHESVLHKAVHQGDREIVKKLIKDGADKNAQDNNGYTPLMQLAEIQDDRDLSMIKLLIEEGVDVRLENFKGQTVYDLASSRVKKLLCEK